MTPSPAHRDVRGPIPRAAVALAAALLLASCAGEREVPELPPFDNLVVIVIDTLRSDHLESYGYSRRTTPFLTRLAGEGIQLQGYSASSWTRTSVATLLTGLYPQRHQTVTRADQLPATAAYLPEILSGEGFHTAAYVANATVADRFGFARGYEHFRSHGGDKFDKPHARTVTDEGLALAAELPSRYYLYLHYLDPHDPYVPEVPWGGSADDERVQVDDVVQGRAPKNAENLRRLRDQYDGAIHEMDRELERLLTTLAESGALDSTLVVVTADHGEEFNEHRGLRHGLTLYEEVIRVPLILWSSSRLPSYRSRARFHHVDFLPTVLEALGLASPGQLDGRSQWREVLADAVGRDDPEREYLFALDLGASAAVSLLAPPYKIIHQRSAPTTLLYRLARDPAERENLAGEKEKRSALLRRLIRAHNELSEQGAERETTVLDLDTRRRLEALGYLQLDTPQAELEKKNLPARLHYYDSRVFGLFAGLPPGGLRTELDLAAPSGQLLGGWAAGKEDGRWSLPTARFALPLRPGARRLVLSGRLDDSRPEARCAVEVNGHEAGSFEVGQGDFEEVVALPEKALRTRMAYVELTITPSVAREGRRQPFGMFWRRLAVR